MFFVGSLFASDMIGVDSLFKKQSGIRSITSLSFLSTGNPNSYRIYPNVNLEETDSRIEDTKRLSLQQTLIYTVMPSFDIITSVGGSFKREESFEIANFNYKSNDKLQFNAWWLGFIYTAPKFSDFVPQITVQSSVIGQESFRGEYKNFYVNSQSLKLSLRSYSDPIVYSIYTSLDYNHTRKFRTAKIDYGHGVSIGADASIILSPKFSFDTGIEQRIQTPQKINSIKASHVRSIPTLSLGMTYSLNSSSAFSIFGMAGGSSSAPDSLFGLSFWKKF